MIKKMYPSIKSSISIKEERELAQKTANCYECENKGGCKHKHKPNRLPGELFTYGMDLCPKIMAERW